MDLFTIVGGDLGFGDQYTLDPSLLLITYNQSVNGFGQDRMNAIINYGFPNDVVILGVDCTYLINGQPICNGSPAVTIVTPWPNCTGGAPVYSNNAIGIIYDVTQCNNSKYYVFDANG